MDIHGRVTLDHFGTCYGPGPFKIDKPPTYTLIQVPLATPTWQG